MAAAWLLETEISFNYSFSSLAIESVFMEIELAGLSINEEEDEIIQIPSFPSPEKGKKGYCLVGYFLTTSVINFTTMKNKMANLWHQVRGV